MRTLNGTIFLETKDKPFNNNQDIWFSSSNKIYGTNAKSWIMKQYNILDLLI